ncbi:Carbon-monoxide dehydrogenase (Acceptor) [Carbonactinospora thermoautotrophica]|uniref:Carbon-monoxide dehydrogenase (Acceptor) n=1 Tax=Carbonactinospora thermoautotrophica TaxID=1469144 RepID=A0A132MT49_9ACTN|nr:(2Fe-2S)-binding protein [Carbonactinospora thermoautotrophica]KWX00916.1 Carbon-monoxide dehydrogenase (Acceptor) [Carbonactinospora thermoautotrophica]
MQEITITINGKAVTAEVDERTLLLEFIRDVAGYTGTHNGCLEARCGCCAVEVDGDIVKSCNVLALQVAGRSVTTIEGLSPQRLTPVEHITTQSLAGVYEPLDALGADEKTLHPIQAAFHRRHALQCGFCTPGMIMVLKDYLEDNPEPTRADVRQAICGNLCRCTGYQHIIDAAMEAAEEMRLQAAMADATADGGDG